MTSNILSSSFLAAKEMKKILRKCFILCRTKKIYLLHAHGYFSSTVQSNNHYCHSVKCFFFLISPLLVSTDNNLMLCAMLYKIFLLYVYTDCFTHFLKKYFSLDTAFFAYTTREDDSFFFFSWLPLRNTQMKNYTNWW